MPRVIGVFEDSGPARAALEDLERSGIPTDALSLMAPDEGNGDDEEFEDQDDDSEDEQGDGDGSDDESDVFDTIADLATTGGLLAIPGAGTYVQVGPLAAGLEAVVKDADRGPEGSGESEFIRERLKQGRTMVVVEAQKGRVEEIAGVMRLHGATDVEVM